MTFSPGARGWVMSNPVMHSAPVGIYEVLMDVAGQVRGRKFSRIVQVLRQRLKSEALRGA